MGYVGGLVATALVVAFLGNPTLENFSRIRWVGPFTALFFLVTAIPTFMWVHEHGAAQPLKPGQTYMRVGFQRLHRTLREIGRFRDLAILLLSIFSRWRRYTSSSPSPSSTVSR